MPAKIGKDSEGCYARWGNQQKYYYECNNTEARKQAIEKANKQGQAIRAQGYKNV